MQEVLATIEAGILKRGFTMVSMVSDGVVPEFTYTVGMASKGLPDIIITGVSAEVARPILSELVTRVMAGQAPVGEHLSKIANFPVVLHAAEEFGPVLMRIAFERAGKRGERFRPLQLIYPDRHGIFPGEADCDANIEKLQDLAVIANGGRPPLRIVQ